MKYLLTPLFFSFFLLSCTANESSEQGANQPKDTAEKAPAANVTSTKSIPSETTGTVGSAVVKINYHAPAVRGRVIWGGLVPYNSVWVTGAHKATTLEVNSDFKVGDKMIPAGKYAIFTIPGKDEWTLIINKNWNQHLADDYSEAEDMVRLKVKPQTTGEVTERLKYEIKERENEKADIAISWEKLTVSFPIEIKE